VVTTPYLAKSATCAPAAPGSFSYFSNTSNLTYVLSTYNRTFEDANMECKLQGGSLATYRCARQDMLTANNIFPRGWLS
jgi:hypothetical protein